MNIYLDDDTANHVLVKLLRKAGHTVAIPADVSLQGSSDARHFIHAIHRGFVVLSRNHDDYLELHDVVIAAKGSHPGVLLIRADNDPTRDMTLRGIVTAIGKVHSSGAQVESQCFVLNHWR